MKTPQGDADLFQHFSHLKNHTVAVVPNTSEVQIFLDHVNYMWLNMQERPGKYPIDFVMFHTKDDLMSAYWTDPKSIPIAVVFDEEDPLQYEIRTNPSFVVTPQTTELYSSPANCRESVSHWAGIFPIETGDSCPVNQYYYSGFVALQTLLDYTKIRLDSNKLDLQVPHFLLELFPKEAFTGYWMVAFRVIIPLYMVMALSQFITYLLILIVGEKEKKIKEGMKIMGLKDSVFWLSWFIIYAIFTTFLSIISCVLLFSLQVFQHTNYILIFLLTLLYSFSIIMFGFLITPFFDKSRTAGILGNFAVNMMSLFYFIQVFVDDSDSIALWIVSLISSSGFALAMDKALVLDLSGNGVSFDNLWAGPGISFGGSLIMMAFDTILYGFLAYYLDSVIPSEHGVKRKPWFCFTLNFWCPNKKSPTVPLVNGESGSFDTSEEATRDVEPVAREMKGREAIRIVDLYKSFRSCRKPEIKAVNGINLTIYEGQITAILGHNGAGKTTLFNILTGLTSPTAGTALVFGYDIRDPNGMSNIRQMIGVCPQHDILFDLLTPREHLEFFAVVRGIPKNTIEMEVTKTLRDIDLVDKADTFAKYLSGGQKRKLSVGIAVIGDPKIIILDEPTAGVDPYSRRHLWSVLQNRRHGKVFLHLERDEETDCVMDNLSKKMVRNRALSRSLSLQSKSTSYQSLQNEIGGISNNVDGITKPQNENLENNILHANENAPLTGVQGFGETYLKETNLAVYNGSDTNLDQFYKMLLMSGFDDIEKYNGNYSLLLEVKPHMAALNINVFEPPFFNITAIYNDTMQHSLPILMNLLNNALYRFFVHGKSSGMFDPPIVMKTHPFQQTSQPEGLHFGTFTSALFIGMTFVLVPVSLAVDMVYDREIKARNQLRVNGLSFSQYFLTYVIVLGVLMLFICFSLILLILIFDLPSLREPPAFMMLGILIILYCPSSILCCTCLSYIFDKADTALSILPNIVTFSGIIPFSLVIILDMFRIGGRAVIGLHTFFSLVNTLYVPYAVIYFVDRVYIMCSMNPACNYLVFSDYLTDEIIIMIFSSLLHIPFWFLMLRIVDVKKSGGKISEAFQFLTSNDSPNLKEVLENSDVGEYEDVDVKSERTRVSDILNSNLQNPPVVVVHNLRKEYVKSSERICNCCKKDEVEPNRKLAVRNLSVAVEAGEVFGLLGHNGAGKTTTMKIMIAEEGPTKGQVQIGGYNIISNISDAFQIMGYCPQHDAQWKNITVREHLECYAAIRGVPPEEISRVVEMYLQGLQISEHANKQSQHCSGGTKRKLSFAMAMVGDPRVVLMDEPSTGMDPKSKRFLWDTILASFQGSRGAILTTHSMEEADALCSRVGIMVKGELRCIGSTQHLKNLYGAGYTLEIKLRGGDLTPTTPGSNRTDDLKNFVSELFPDAILEESFADRLVFSVSQQSVTSLAQCFSNLEKAKTELDVEEYSFSQTTLEQVFLKFAHYDEINED
ncbi:predicted protein [Pediculus humanus corporis]|uniref:Predicted protein n=1 Tax=Pediculus humanus subsp. corporis TaxID=121224 RepID=E0VHQ3_PEDHC|nr:uncharacterized protein Phum_PHUM214970 [Pediculus humanus corporis]EEB12939.1 predicted protein [Pediculus humanus corporis]